MKNILLALICLCTLPIFAQSDLEMRLFDLPDVRFTKIDAPKGYEAAYELRIKQPIDHKDPSKGHFYQKVYLSHKCFDCTSVIITEGYSRGRNRMYELSTMLDANQLDVEHRYFGQSIPEDVGYEYLTLEQATADLHHVNQLFRQIYAGKWVSTGISKGGQTTIFYRYFYPDDVDVSVPYVAPLNLSLEDERIYKFLDKVGDKACRKKIYQTQIRLLENREAILPKLEWFAKGAQLKFTYMTLEQAFEYAVLEYPFSFWQWGTDCASLPNDDVSIDALTQHFIDVVGVAFYSDRDVDVYASHYYQAGTQMGYYGFDTEDFKGLLKALPMEPHPSAIFMPSKSTNQFDDTLINEVSDWLKVNGNEFIYIYGANDTWTATGVPPSKKTNSLWFIMDGKHHGNARIHNLDESDKAKLTQALETWLEVKIK